MPEHPHPPQLRARGIRREINAAALQYVRKIAGTTKPSKASKRPSTAPCTDRAHHGPSPAGPGRGDSAEEPRRSGCESALARSRPGGTRPPGARWGIWSACHPRAGARRRRMPRAIARRGSEAVRRSGHGLHRHQHGLVRPSGRAPLLDEVSFRVGEGRRPRSSARTGRKDHLAAHHPRGRARAWRSGLDRRRPGRDGPVRGPRHPRRDRPRPADRCGSAPHPRGRDRTGSRRGRDHRTTTWMRSCADATALADYADAGGYEHETVWDQCTVAALGIPSKRAVPRATTLSGGSRSDWCSKALLRGPDDVLLPDERQLPRCSGQAVARRAAARHREDGLLVSHDRELLARGADRIVTLGTGAAGSTAWVHGGSFATYHQARIDRMDRLDELRRRWDEQHEKLKALVAAMKVKAAANDGFASATRPPSRGCRDSRRPGRPRSARPSRTCS